MKHRSLKSWIFAFSFFLLLPLVLLPTYLYIQAWGGTIKGQQHFVPVVCIIILGGVLYFYLIVKIQKYLSK